MSTLVELFDVNWTSKSKKKLYYILHGIKWYIKFIIFSVKIVDFIREQYKIHHFKNVTIFWMQIEKIKVKKHSMYASWTFKNNYVKCKGVKYNFQCLK